MDFSIKKLFKRFKVLASWYLVTFKPFWIFILLIIFHQIYIRTPCLAFESLCFDNDLVDKYFPTILTFLGSFSVLYSLNSNLSNFKGNNIFTHYKNKLGAYPKAIVGHVNVTLDSPTISVSAVNGEVILTKPPETVQELYELMDQRFIKQRSEVKQLYSELKSDISKSNSKTEQLIAKAHQEAQDVRRDLQHLAVGGADLQVFGVFLVLYGSLLNIS
jgi:hypothetical protein